MLPLLLSLHLLNPVGSPAQALHLLPVPSLSRDRPATLLLAGPDDGPSGVAQLSAPPERRGSPWVWEAGAGALALLVSDGLVVGSEVFIDKGLAPLPFFNGGPMGIPAALLMYGSFGLPLLEFFAVPLVVSAAVGGFADRVGDRGGRYFGAVLAAFLAEAVLDAAGVATWEAIGAAYAGHQPAYDHALLGSLVAFLLVRAVAIPLAASVGLHLGSKEASQGSTATRAVSHLLRPTVRATPPEAQGRADAFLLPLVNLSFE